MGPPGALRPRDVVAAVRAYEELEAAGWGGAGKAEAYDAFLGQVTARAADALLDAAGAGRGSRLLDVATGPGYVAGRAAARGAIATGIDASEEMLALARRRLPGVDLRRADVERLPFPDGAFDAVVGGFVVNHLPRPEAAAAELVRVLAPGGRLALSMWDAPERSPLFGLVLLALEDAGLPPPDTGGGPPQFRFSSDAELGRLLAGAGLGDVRVETLALTHRVGSAEALWRGVLGGSVRTAGHVLGQPEDVRRRVRTAFDRRAAAYAAAPGGALVIPVRIKLASGRGAGSASRPEPPARARRPALAKMSVSSTSPEETGMATTANSQGVAAMPIEALPQIWDGWGKLVRKGLGIRAFGVQIMDYPAGHETHAHDESETGQEELYLALRGSGELLIDGGAERFALDPDHIARVSAGVSRTIVAGPEGVRVLCVGGVPGVAYEPPEHFS